MQACNAQRTTCNTRRATYNLATYDVQRAPLPGLVCALPAQSLRPRRARDVPTLAADLVVFAYEPMRQSHDTLLQAIDTIGAVNRCIGAMSAAAVALRGTGGGPQRKFAHTSAARLWSGGLSEARRWRGAQGYSRVGEGSGGIRG
jgi:hypothetical protein